MQRSVRNTDAYSTSRFTHSPSQRLVPSHPIPGRVAVQRSTRLLLRLLTPRNLARSDMTSIEPNLESLTAGSLSSASHTQTFAYDTPHRLTSGPLGSYTYGDSAHLHAVTVIGSDTPTYTPNMMWWAT